MPNLFMLVGVPGSGKSTWVKEMGYWNTTGTMILSTDNYIETVASGANKTYSEVFKDTIKAAETHMDMCLDIAIANSMDIIWDQTNLTVKTRKKKLALIPVEYKKVAVVFPTPPTEVHNEWLNSSTRRGKVIPPIILKTMIETFETPTIYEGFDTVINKNPLHNFT